ncbi:phosphotransferase family protein [Nakamurella leprariae]|uniref:Phosphotransferase n=1 Tax=Nakamurella leprariae TaxID=2803911 RepID=A0A938YK57_9ACTN|nr:phosphotransferase [Nakamurella leprariae]MBM9469368.1 phosphotransferase [Nakamurella leprariae]
MPALSPTRGPQAVPAPTPVPSGPTPVPTRVSADALDLLTDLTAAGVLDLAAVTDVQMVHRRSAGYRITLQDGRRWFAKRAQRRVDGTWSADLTTEGANHRVALGLPGVRPLLPRLVHARHDILVTECIDDHRHLDDHRAAAGGTDPVAAAALGSVVRRLHAAGRRATGARPVNHAAAAVGTWLSPTPTLVAQHPAGFTELTVRIRAAGLAAPLTRLAAGWRSITFIHGDLKSDNLFLRAADDDGHPAVRIIDWETAGLGDPRWDVGSLIGNHLFSWLAGLDFRQGQTLADWLAGAEVPWPRVQDETRTLLWAYDAGPADDHPAPLDAAGITTVGGYAAVFLLQRVTASALTAPVLPPLALAAVQVAAALLTTDAAVELLS